jgi:hypothetical protein
MDVSFSICCLPQNGEFNSVLPSGEAQAYFTVQFNKTFSCQLQLSWSSNELFQILSCEFGEMAKKLVMFRSRRALSVLSRLAEYGLLESPRKML